MNGHKYPRAFEPINGSLERLKVPGGWLAHNSTTVLIQDKHVTASECLVFVPDPNYEWALEAK